MQWLVHAFVTVDIRGGGGGDCFPKNDTHSLGGKKVTFSYRIAIRFSPEIISRSWLSNKRKKITLERTSLLKFLKNSR